jgi:hypothetical protein
VAQRSARISNRIELQRLIAARELPARIELEPGLLLPEQRVAWESALNNELSACGCGQASFAALIATAVLTALGFTWLADWSLGLRFALVFLGSGAVMTITKGLAIARARQRWRTGLAELLATLETQTG